MHWISPAERKTIHPLSCIIPSKKGNVIQTLSRLLEMSDTDMPVVQQQAHTLKTLAKKFKQEKRKYCSNFLDEKQIWEDDIIKSTPLLHSSTFLRMNCSSIIMFFFLHAQILTYEEQEAWEQKKVAVRKWERLWMSPFKGKSQPRQAMWSKAWHEVQQKTEVRMRSCWRNRSWNRISSNSGIKNSFQ